MHISKLKREAPFYSRNEYGDKRIKNLKKDIKVLKKAIENQDYTGAGLSESNSSFFVIVVDNDLEEALRMTKGSLKRAFQERFYKQRAERFLFLTGNKFVDNKTIQMLEECRYLLEKGEATEEEIFQILPSNHKFTM